MLYIYDGTFEGALSAIFAAYNDKNADIVSPEHNENSSLYSENRVQTSPEHALRVQRGLEKLSRGVPARFYRAWLSHDRNAENLMLAVARLGFAEGCDPFAMRGHDAVCRLDALARKVSVEQERMLQFVRFVRLGEREFAADIEPQYDVLPLIGAHFHKRFPDSRLLIRDLKRGSAVVSDPQGWHIAPLPDNNPPLPDNGSFEKMWRGYCDTIAIEGRYNPKLQRQNVPLKYRAHMTEFADGEK